MSKGKIKFVKMPGEPIEWVDPAGLRTPIGDMSDRHLDNCIAMIRRRRERDEPNDQFMARWGHKLGVLLAEKEFRFQIGLYGSPDDYYGD